MVLRTRRTVNLLQNWGEELSLAFAWFQLCVLTLSAMTIGVAPEPPLQTHTQVRIDREQKGKPDQHKLIHTSLGREDTKIKYSSARY